MKGREVKRKVENPRRQRSSGAFTASEGESRAPVFCLHVCSGDLGLHSLPRMKQTLQYGFVQNPSF